MQGALSDSDLFRSKVMLMELILGLILFDVDLILFRSAVKVSFVESH
jgi:hypothetical protein